MEHRLELSAAGNLMPQPILTCPISLLLEFYGSGLQNRFSGVHLHWFSAESSSWLLLYITQLAPLLSPCILINVKLHLP